MAIGFVAVVILGPGNAKPVLGARVYVAPNEDGRVLSARIATVWRLGQTESPAPDVELDVTLGERRFPLMTGDDGIVEARFEGSTPGSSGMTARAGGAVVAAGKLEIDDDVTARWNEPPIPERDGAIFDLRPVRGQLTPPFTEQLAVESLVPGPGFDAHVVIELTGASPARLEGDIGWTHDAWLVDVVPEALRVDFDAKAVGNDGRESRITGSLSTVPGAMWLDPSSPPNRLDFVAPAPRKVAYVSFWTERGRVGGGKVRFREDAAGFHRGTIARPALDGDGTLDVVVAGDADELGPATVMWPVVAGASGSRVPWRRGDLAPRLARAIDGVPQAIVAEQARVTRLRSLAIAVAVVVGLLEIALLVWKGRRAQHDLNAHFIAQADVATGVEDSDAIRHVATSAAKSGNRMATVLGVLIAFAFGIIAAFVVAR